MLSRLPSAMSIVVLASGMVFAAEDQPARSRPRVRFGGFSVGAGYSHFSGPFFYPYYSAYGYYPYGAYGWDPFFYGSMHPGFWTGFGYQPSMGEIKLRSADREAWVYLDGALAGKAENLKKIWLQPGVYNLEVRSGQKQFAQKVYVLSGKTLRLNADDAKAGGRP